MKDTKKKPSLKKKKRQEEKSRGIAVQRATAGESFKKVKGGPALSNTWAPSNRMGTKRRPLGLPQLVYILISDLSLKLHFEDTVSPQKQPRVHQQQFVTRLSRTGATETYKGSHEGLTEC